MNRDHETWHNPAVAKSCQEQWDTDSERAGIRRLAAFAAGYLSSSRVMLDVGCGTGRLYRELVPSVITSEQYIGVDVAQPMLDLAAQESPDGRFWPGDLYDLSEYDDGTFDVVTCFAVLGHIPDIAKPIAEMFRVSSDVVIFDVWPTDHGIAEEAEETAGTTALHRSYSDEVIWDIACDVMRGQLAGFASFDWGANKLYALRRMSR